ncbi:unnamed protein product, partial [Tetraodon nigroviridis]
LEYNLQSDSLSPCELLRSVAVAKQQANVPQCAEDGRFRPVQCKMGGQECWCVDAEGQEVIGTRTNSSAPLCASPCQLQSLLRCSPSGLFEEVQCEPSRGQCWCVDQDGMELYGTRQSGRPSRWVELLLSDVYDSAFVAHPPIHTFAQSNIYQVLQRRMLAVRLAVTGHFRCPSSCEEEQRSAKEALNVYIPSCEPGGTFSSRQCQQGGQCWCVDATGLELPGSRQQGDSLDCSKGPKPVAAIILVISTSFVDPLSLPLFFCCSSDPADRGPDSCPSMRRHALFHLFSASAPFQSSSFGRSQISCTSLVQTLSNLLPVEEELLPFLSQLVEVVGGLFHTVGGALRALSDSSHHRLQENLFGGNFLRKLTSSNFSGLVGTRGPFVLDWVSRKGDSIQENQDLVKSVSRVLGDQAFLLGLQVALGGHSSLLPLEQILTALLRSCSVTQHPTFLPSCTPSGAFRDVQCDVGQCWCVDSQGHELLGFRSAGWPSRCPSACEQQQASALRRRATLAAGAEVYVPACSEDGDFLPLQCVASHCFCVDVKGNSVG